MRLKGTLPLPRVLRGVSGLPSNAGGLVVTEKSWDDTIAVVVFATLFALYLAVAAL